MKLLSMESVHPAATWLLGFFGASETPVLLRHSPCDHPSCPGRANEQLQTNQHSGISIDTKSMIWALHAFPKYRGGARKKGCLDCAECAAALQPRAWATWAVRWAPRHAGPLRLRRVVLYCAAAASFTWQLPDALQVQRPPPPHPPALPPPPPPPYRAGARRAYIAIQREIY